MNVLKKCFDGFCQDGAIQVDTIGTILTMMGLRVKPSALKEIIEEVRNGFPTKLKKRITILKITFSDRRGRVGLPGVRGVLPAEC